MTIKRIPGKNTSKPAKKDDKHSFTPAAKKDDPNDETMRLNKFIANAGICSRREADHYIETGRIKVNGKIITEMGYKVYKTDTVTVDNKAAEVRRKHLYILLNKPRGYITTTKDPQERKTVMELIKFATSLRVYPVGRLDRNSSGLLLLTNDGDLTNDLLHPSKHIKKLYAVTLNRALSKNDYIKIVSEGVQLEDGLATTDEIEYTDPKDLSKIGVSIHSGKNRVIRRMFEALGYEVMKLDRVMFGMLTKKDLPSGKWRFLNEKEVRILKSQIK